jgi:hypothetical protein
MGAVVANAAIDSIPPTATLDGLLNCKVQGANEGLSL